MHIQENMTDVTKMSKSEAGRKGSDKTWAKRYKILEELSKYVDKGYQNYLLSWKTEHLIRLLKAYEK